MFMIPINVGVNVYVLFTFFLTFMNSIKSAAVTVVFHSLLLPLSPSFACAQPRNIACHRMFHVLVSAMKFRQRACLDDFNQGCTPSAGLGHWYFCAHLWCKIFSGAIISSKSPPLPLSHRVWPCARVCRPNWKQESVVIIVIVVKLVILVMLVILAMLAILVKLEI